MRPGSRNCAPRHALLSFLRTGTARECDMHPRVWCPPSIDSTRARHLQAVQYRAQEIPGRHNFEVLREWARDHLRMLSDDT